MEPEVAKSAGAASACGHEWDEQHGKLVDLSAFWRDILPLIRDVPLSRLQRATGLSLRYVSLIRRGERTPHPRHWQAFAAAASGRQRLGGGALQVRVQGRSSPFPDG
jgi:hypothetical protein